MRALRLLCAALLFVAATVAFAPRADAGQCIRSLAHGIACGDICRDGHCWSYVTAFGVRVLAHTW